MHFDGFNAVNRFLMEAVRTFPAPVAEVAHPL
jgi:hypothetical protein